MKQRIKFIFTTWFIAISLFTINAQDVQTNKNDMENLNLTNEWDKTFPQSDKVKHSKVTFRNRYGITLAADLYMPKNAEGKFVRLLSVVGDPDNPINEGCACSKGSAMFNLREIYEPETGHQVVNPKRVQKPLYRAPGSEKWEEKEWDWILDEIAQRIKQTRDASFIHKEKIADGTEIIVNRTEKIASIGGSGLDNEECYLLTKMMRSLGVVFLETQARI